MEWFAWVLGGVFILSFLYVCWVGWRLYKETGIIVPPTSHAYASVRLSDGTLVPLDQAGHWLIPLGVKVIGFVFPACLCPFSPIVRVGGLARGWVWVFRQDSTRREICLFEPIDVDRPMTVAFVSTGMSVQGGLFMPGEPLGVIVEVAPAILPLKVFASS